MISELNHQHEAILRTIEIKGPLSRSEIVELVGEDIDEDLVDEAVRMSGRDDWIVTGTPQNPKYGVKEKHFERLV